VKATPLIALLGLIATASAAAPSTPPEFTHSRAEDWINSPPLTLAALKGKVVVLDFWAFKCVNCLNSRAWLDSLERDKGPRGLVVVGVHTPELAEERSPGAVRKAVERLGIHYPVVIDEDSSYWRALHVEAWPTFCLIGRDGLLYVCLQGEMHSGDQRDAAVEQVLDKLLATAGPSSS
jgi:thiol-disulfide isomerase/thioredoxin